MFPRPDIPSLLVPQIGNSTPSYLSTELAITTATHCWWCWLPGEFLISCVALHLLEHEFRRGGPLARRSVARASRRSGGIRIVAPRRPYEPWTLTRRAQVNRAGAALARAGGTGDTCGFDAPGPAAMRRAALSRALDTGSNLRENASQVVATTVRGEIGLTHELPGSVGMPAGSAGKVGRGARGHSLQLCCRVFSKNNSAF